MVYGSQEPGKADEEVTVRATLVPTRAWQVYLEKKTFNTNFMDKINEANIVAEYGEEE